MKTKPTQIDRSGAKWLPGAMALAATAASSQAANVQITLTGNKVSSTSAGGNTLDADLTGDGDDDVSLTATFYNTKKAFVKIANKDFFAYYLTHPFVGPYFLGIYEGNANSGAPFSHDSSIPVLFSDDRINSGLETGGWLWVTVSSASKFSHTVQLSRLVFDDSNPSRPTVSVSQFPEWQVSAVPEPSGFAATGLLLGAAGLIRRRQARAA